MNRIQTAAAAVLLLCARCALADPVFFDDFDGDDLKPWWKKPPPNQWEYTVADSLFSVTYVSDGAAYITTTFVPLGDAEATAAMGWAESDDHDREFHFAVFGANKWLAHFTYIDKYPDERILAGVPGSPLVQIPAPPAGIHDFEIMRQAGEFHFLLDGASVAVLPDLSGDPINGVMFSYSVVGQIDPLIVDRVQVVPAPSSMVVLLSGVCGAGRRRRRTP